MFVQPEDRPVLPQGTLAQAQGSARPREIGYLGAPFRDLADETIQTLKLPPGARTMLARVIPTGPAAGAGLLAGDVLLSINGVPITGRTEWNLGYKSGETVKLTIFRNGQSMTVDVTLIDASAGATIGLVNGGADLIIPSEKRIAELFPAAQFPLEWAQAQYNIAFAYTGNPKGDKVENEEASIPYYEAALSIEVFKGRIAWNTAQINLGLAYQHRRQGGRQDNLERAIAAFTAVVTSRPKGSTDWARTQMLLGYAYLNRLAGDKNGNYLHAIAAFEAALAIKETTLHQSQLMQMQDRRGDLYRLIEPLNSRENIENAIAAYKEALQYKPLGNKAELQIWAKVAEKLGNCYRQRIGRPATENAALAVEAYDQALTVFTRQAYPDDNLRIYAQRNDAQAAAGIILPGPHL
jgi:tetratricopeptide (TPR) repeat protein